METFPWWNIPVDDAYKINIKFLLIIILYNLIHDSFLCVKPVFLIHLWRALDIT